MDIEGIDVAIIYGTRGRQVLMHDDLDPAGGGGAGPGPQQLDPRLLRRTIPTRLKFAAQLAFHDIPAAIAEARRAVRELGAVAVIGNPNPINGRHIHDPGLRAPLDGRSRSWACPWASIPRASPRCATTSPGATSTTRTGASSASAGRNPSS